MVQLILVRHGQSEWNKQNLFTGWADVDLSTQGVQEAKDAGIAIKESGIKIDYCYTSVLKRAIRTLWYCMLYSEQYYLPVQPHWRLNERHYGALQGLDKQQTTEKHGKEQVKIWRRSYDIPPPVCDKESEHNPANDSRYQNIDADLLPLSESLKDTLERVLPYWESDIKPQLAQGKNLLVTAHGNSIRALMKHLENISDDEIVNLEIATGKPIVFEFSNDMQVNSKKML